MLNQTNKNKLIKILKDNSKWPLIVEDVFAEHLISSIVIPSNIDTTSLGIQISDNGEYIYPSWLKELKAKESKRNVLCIDRLDQIDMMQQEKFYGIIKNKAINGYKFSPNTQIVVTISKGNISKINKRLLDLCLVVRSSL